MSSKSVCWDLVAALNHDLRSSLSSASLAAGLMRMHDDEEVHGHADRLDRLVKSQTRMLGLAAELMEACGEGPALKANAEEMMRELNASAPADVAACQVEHGSLIARALGVALGEDGKASVSRDGDSLVFELRGNGLDFSERRSIHGVILRALATPEHESGLLRVRVAVA